MNVVYLSEMRILLSLIESLGSAQKLFMKLFTTLLLPLGGSNNFLHSGNSNSKLILKYIIKLSMFITNPKDDIHKSFLCGSSRSVFRFHISHGQPSFVFRKTNRTQDVLLFSVCGCKHDNDIQVWLLYLHGYHQLMLTLHPM